jgi:hypothetical protein
MGMWVFMAILWGLVVFVAAGAHAIEGGMSIHVFACTAEGGLESVVELLLAF